MQVSSNRIWRRTKQIDLKPIVYGCLMHIVRTKSLPGKLLQSLKVIALNLRRKEGNEEKHYIGVFSGIISKVLGVCNSILLKKNANV